MLLKCCLSHRDIDLLRYTIFCVFVSMAMHLDLFIYYLCYFYSTIIFIFITINHIISLKQTNLFFVHVRKSLTSGCCLVFA